jgi:hypothetical protein
VTEFNDVETQGFCPGATIAELNSSYLFNGYIGFLDMTAKVRRIHDDGWTGSPAQAVIVDPRPFSPMSALGSVQQRLREQLARMIVPLKIAI